MASSTTARDVPPGRQHNPTAPRAVVSIALIVIQPTVAGAWRTLCLVSAAISLALFALGSGEARAAWQHVTRAQQRGVRWGDAILGRTLHPC